MVDVTEGRKLRHCVMHNLCVQACIFPKRKEETWSYMSLFNKSVLWAIVYMSKTDYRVVQTDSELVTLKTQTIAFPVPPIQAHLPRWNKHPVVFLWFGLLASPQELWPRGLRQLAFWPDHRGHKIQTSTRDALKWVEYISWAGTVESCSRLQPYTVVAEKSYLVWFWGGDLTSCV